jgi:hypothetical protein
LFILVANKGPWARSRRVREGGRWNVGQRRGKGTIFRAHTIARVAPARFRNLDYAEREGYRVGLTSGLGISEAS